VSQIAIQLSVGLVLSGAIGFAAYRRQSLTGSGVIGAIVVGTATFGFGGWVWGMLLVTFFVSSSLLSHYKEATKTDLAAKFAKGHQRDLGQVLANGGVGTLIALLSLFFSQPATLAALLVAFVGAMAAVTADTWATELGVLSKRPPRLVTTWQRVEVGTSGGVSALGTLAALAGAFAIGLAAAAWTAFDGLLGRSRSTSLGTTGMHAHADVGRALWLVPVAVLSGLAGSTFDSLLGATVQVIYFSAARHKETEKRVDPDGTHNIHRRGWRWLGNDQVNFASSVVGALAALLAWHMIN
jgi:uncharacterized protein (TIGR00297 family)